MAVEQMDRKSEGRCEIVKRPGRRFFVWFAVAAVLLVVAAAAGWLYAMGRHTGPERWVRIPGGASAEQVRDSLRSALGPYGGDRVYRLWALQGGSAEKAHGAYLVREGDRWLSVSRRLRYGRQTPVRVGWSSCRSVEDMTARLAAVLEPSARELMDAVATVLTDRGYDRENFVAAFLPDSYEFYWSSSPENVIGRLVDYRDRFWTAERRQKAARLGLTENEVVTLASIVEEESAKRDEHGTIARLYLNRLAKGMKLQADPTLKFAAGDASIRRLTLKHIAIESPYNTYRHAGLPPGPIRMVDGRTVDAVLDAPVNDYLYMCAKEDFSGYHNFARDYETHRENARRYQAELNKRNIK